MTDRELLDAGNIAELTASHRPALVEVITRKVGCPDAANVLANLAMEQAFENVADWDHEKESFRSWVLYNARSLSQSWETPAGNVYFDLETKAHESMHADFGPDYPTWPEGEFQRRIDDAAMEAFSRPPSILAQVDALYAESTDPAMTWEELDIIRLRAIELQAALAAAA